jgi:hypothetical protein
VIVIKKQITARDDAWVQWPGQTFGETHRIERELRAMREVPIVVERLHPKGELID